MIYTIKATITIMAGVDAASAEEALEKIAPLSEGELLGDYGAAATTFEVVGGAESP